MANKSVFAQTVGRLLPRTDAVNREGAPAFAYDARHRLAQLAMTGTFNDGFYAQAQEQMGDALEACEGVSPEFLAQAAIHARARGHMKDMPAFMLAVLSGQDPALFARAFPRVVDNGRMLRTFVQIVRSGRTGRKSLGSRPKAMIQSWLNTASDQTLLNAAVGKDPSLADIIRMVHPKPKSAQREALYAWLIGKPCDVSLLPAQVRDLIRFRADPSGAVPRVPFQMLTALPLSPAQWAEIAEDASWQMVRMNLNTFGRHGMFELRGMARDIAARLRDPDEIGRARAMPYQLMATLSGLDAGAPGVVRDALHDAMEIAVSNAPSLPGSVAVCPDVSGSMSAPVTGWRRGATSKVRCVDVAALFAAAIVRANAGALVLPFAFDVVKLKLEPRDTIATNAAKMAAVCGGGTNCSAPIARLSRLGLAPDLVVLLSDNQSWVDMEGWRATGSTKTLREWARLRRRNPNARLVCIDIAPCGTTQAAECDDILNIGGFSDSVFDVVAAFAKGILEAGHWVGEIEKVEI